MTSIYPIKRSGKPLSAALEARLRKAAAEAVAMVRAVDTELPADADLDTVVEAVLAVAEERNATLLRLRTALVAHQNTAALAIARELCNLPQ